MHSMASEQQEPPEPAWDTDKLVEVIITELAEENARLRAALAEIANDRAEDYVQLYGGGVAVRRLQNIARRALGGETDE